MSCWFSTTTRAPLRALGRFARREDGYMVVDTVLALPFLCWAFVALYSYWDGYRSATQVQKATYAIADLVSREQRPINADYIDGMRRSMDQILPGDMNTELRVTSIAWSEVRNRYEVEWSAVSGSLSPLLTTSTLAPLVSKIPRMDDGDTAVIVETWVEYDATLALGGVEDMRMSQFVVTPPRFAPRIVYQ
ncbi:MAG: TadE/TadG family type IV pilus assembly protein [Gemmobacter sp.]